MAHIIAFTEPGATEIASVGGKAASLGRLVDLGFRVPPGFTISTDAHSLFLSSEGLAGKVHDIVADLDYDDPADLEIETQKIRDLMLAVELPRELSDQITAAYESLGDDLYVAVRSSGTAEDLAGASFAGLYDTYLDISGRDAVLDAVRRCWASMWTTRVVAYRHQRNFDGETERLAVVVQQMVAPTVSGVMFTANPRTARTDELVINASWGLGEGIVSGILTPDEYLVTLPNLSVKAVTLGDKEKKVIRDPETGLGTVVIDTTAAEQSSRALSDDQIIGLAQVGKDVMSKYGGLPQDMEWALADGTFYVLQARPVTGAEFTWDEDVDGWQTGPDDPDITWTYTWSEMYWTGGISPLFYSCRAYECALNYSRFAKLFGFEDLHNVRWHKYRRATAYFNSDAERSWLLQQWPGQLRDLTNIPPAWQEAFTSAPISKWGLAKMWVRVHALESELGVTKWFKTTYDYLDNRTAEADGPSVEAIRLMSDEELIKEAEARVAFVDEWYITMWPSFFWYATGALGGLGLVLQKWYDGTNASAFQDLISGIPGNKAAVEGEELWALAELIRHSPALKEVFDEHRGLEFFTAAERSEEGRKFLAEYATFIKNHGHRGHQDRDFYYDRRVENPALDYDALVLLLETTDPVDPAEVMHRMVERREATTKEVIANFAGKPFAGAKSQIFTYLVDYCVRFLKYRDDERHYLDRLTYAKKKVFLEIGRRMYENGLIDEPDDFWFLARHELYAYLEGRAPAELTKAKMAARKRVFHRRNERLEPTPTYLRDGVEVDLSGNAAAGAELPEGTLGGVSTSHGLATGTARIVPQLDQVGRVQNGDILVCNSTDPGWMSVFPKIRGLVLETGGMLAHGACLSRECGIPAVQIRNAMQFIDDEAWITVNGDNGTVKTETAEPALAGDAS